MLNWSNIVSPIIGFVGVGISTAIYYRAKDLVSIIESNLTKKLENYALKECVVSHEQLLQHKIEISEKYATIDNTEAIKESIDKISDKIDNLTIFLMKKGE